MIKRTDFLKGNFQKRNNNRKEHPIYKLLKEKREFAFTTKEIAEKTKMNEMSIRSMLSKLREDGLITHKSPFWALK